MTCIMVNMIDPGPGSRPCHNNESVSEIPHHPEETAPPQTIGQNTHVVLSLPESGDFFPTILINNSIASLHPYRHK